MISDESPKKSVRHRLEDFEEAAAEPTFLSYINKNHRDYQGEVTSSGFSNPDSREFEEAEIYESANVRSLPPKVFTQRRGIEKPSIDPSMLEPINRPAQKSVVKNNVARPAVIAQTAATQTVEIAASNADGRGQG